MNRCSKPLNAAFFIAISEILALAGTLFHSKSEARTQHLFPHKTQRGSLTFTAPPRVLLDGRPERLGPGVRVRDARNRWPRARHRASSPRRPECRPSTSFVAGAPTERATPRYVH